MMKKQGFTLVELAIVMTIIGLLIGGVLKGQELLDSARMIATVSQIKSYDAAMRTFGSAFGGMPGDLKNAGNRIPGCNANCTPAAATAGDRFIGDPAWASGGWSGQNSMSYPPDSVLNETVLFWLHLAKANIISGIDTSVLDAPRAAQLGVTSPYAKIGGGFVIGYNRGAGNVFGKTYGAQPGTVLGITTNNTGRLQDSTPGEQALTPARAAQLDRKIDDGISSRGSVVAFGASSSCATTIDGVITYDETVTTKDCGLIINIRP